MQSRVIRVRGGMIALLAFTSTVVRAVPLVAQSVNADSTPVTAPYRTPQIALVQPAPAAALEQSNPAVVFRIAQGDSSDALDLTSFEVAIDGADRTPQFHVDSTEAWGSLDPPTKPDTAGRAETLALGAHLLTARICSVRRICADIRAAVRVVSTASAPSDPHRSKPKSRLVAAVLLVLALIRRLITL